MKCVIFLAVLAFAAARPDAYERLESVNVDEVMGNDRLLKNMVHCLIGDGKCTAEVSEVKEALPEALKTTCGKCTPPQKKVVARIMKAMIEKLPEEWSTLYKQHDPEEARKEELNKFLAENA